MASDYARFSFRNDKKECERIPEQHVGLLQGNINASNVMLINKGEDDQMEVACFKTCRLKSFFTYLSFFLTGGISWLFFHWYPHLFLFATSSRCSVNQATKILVTEIYDKNHKIYHVKNVKVLTPNALQKKKDEDMAMNHNQIDVNVQIQSLQIHFEKGEFKDIDKLIMFSCKKVTYVWDADKEEFLPLTGLDKDVSSEVLHKNKGLSYEEQFIRRQVYNSNKISVEISSIPKLLYLEVLNPFYIFQILSFVLWFLDDYFYYAGAIILMSIFGITMSVIQTRRNQQNLRSTVNSSDVCTVLRRNPKSLQEGQEQYISETISTELLVPGDILEIPSHGCTMHCDALLLTGNCILNESMLTGESVPVTKTPLPNVQDVIYDPKEHGRHTLFCGTNVIQTRYIGTEKVLAVVVRTGFSTAKGSLVRSILYPPPVDFRFEKDSYRFIALLAIVSGLGFIYTVITKVLRGVSARDLILEAFDLITIVVPPALPAAMTVGRFNAQTRLKKKQIFCISPRTINISGSINCVCFDKTGTLTEDGLDLLCVVPIENREFGKAVKTVDQMPYNTFVCGLVSCHSLTTIDKKIVGDPLDLKMFESTKWTIEEQDVADNNKFDLILPTVLKPPKNRPCNLQNEDLEIGIIREFPFSSSLQRMGVIISKLSAGHFEYYCKGSPEMILNFVNKESIPDNFSEVLERYTQKGYRVIAMAHKVLKLKYAKVHKVKMEALEQDLNLLGLIVLENRLKPETTPSIKALNEAKIRVIMVTGDNILTALSVAKECDIVKPFQSVITVNVDGSNPPNLYYTLANTESHLGNVGNGDFSLLSNSESVYSLDTVESQMQTISNNQAEKRVSGYCNNYRFAVTGKVWGVVKEFYPEIVPRLVTRGSIFARMSPEQKQQLVHELQSLGYCVAMCGDGANDCGALKAAHTGISLSEAESSVASPFTSKNPNITCVLDVIREGRAALVTSFGIFKYMAAYSLCQFISVLILYSIDSNLTDMEFLYIDLAIITAIAFFFGKTEAYPGKLVKETPLSSLISLSPVLSLILQIFLVVLFQVISFEHLISEEWYVQFNASAQIDKDDNGCTENYTIFTISSFQYIILAIVFSKGKPYRKSIFSNYGFIITTFVMTCFSTYLALYPAEPLREFFELIVPESMTFRSWLLVYAVANFIISIAIEHFVIDQLVFKKCRFKFHDVTKSKKKFLAVEQELNRDTKWPVLTSDYKSASSPQNPLPVCTAEIVVEKENKFDHNHVLNKLYENPEDVQQEMTVVPMSLSANASPQHVLLNNETGYYSQEDLLFSSLPSDKHNLTSPSDTFQSLSNDTNYDLASSHMNIADLPYDESPGGIPASPKITTLQNSTENSLSNFNAFGSSPLNAGNFKDLELNHLNNAG